MYRFSPYRSSGSIMNYKVTALLLVAFGASLAVKLPNGWIKCKLDDPKHNECMRKAIQRTLPDLLKGIPSLKISTIDPLHFEELEIQQGNGPVNIKLNFKDFDMMGVRNGIIDSVENDHWKTVTVNVSVPEMSGKGQYKIGGKILVLPITGHGEGQLILRNFKATITATFSVENKKGKDYYKMDDMKMILYCDPFIMKFENLFDGNKQLGDQMSVFLDENSKEVWNELKGPIADALSQAFLQLSNRLFSRVPKDDITPPK